MHATVYPGEQAVIAKANWEMERNADILAICARTGDAGAERRGGPVTTMGQAARKEHLEAYAPASLTRAGSAAREFAFGLPVPHSEGAPLDDSPRHVVVVHANDDYCAALAAGLRAQGFSAIEVDDPRTAVWHIAAGGRIDAVVIDTDLPRTLGIALLLRLHGLGVTAPVALVASVCDDRHEEAALEYGAAEFFGKARRLSIVIKRLRLLIDGPKSRAAEEPTTAEVVEVGRLGLKLRSHRAYWNGVQVPLTVTEFKIVRLLASRSGEEVTYRDIYDVVHGNGFMAGDGPQGYRSNVRSLIRKIRNRFRTIDPQFAEIENYPGFGYRWRDTASGGADRAAPEADQEGLCADCRNALAAGSAAGTSGLSSR